MAPSVDVAGQHDKARRRLLGRTPETCRFTLDDFVSENVSVPDLLARLDATA